MITIKIILAAIFTLSVVAKFMGKTKSTFETAGYSSLIMYAVAAAEILFTLALFTRYALFAEIGLLAIMGGAIFTLVRQKVQPEKYILALVATVLLIVLLVLQVAG